MTAYFLRSATLQVDKLNALAGIGPRCYVPLLGPGYFAGMWDYGLLRQPTWETSDFHESLPYPGVTVTRPLLDSGLSRAPSWSWASVERGVVRYDRFPKVKKDDDSSSGEDSAEENWNEVPTFDMITNRIIGSRFAEFDSPFKRVLREPDLYLRTRIQSTTQRQKLRRHSSCFNLLRPSYCQQPRSRSHAVVACGCLSR